MLWFTVGLVLGVLIGLTSGMSVCNRALMKMDADIDALTRRVNEIKAKRDAEIKAAALIYKRENEHEQGF